MPDTIYVEDDYVYYPEFPFTIDSTATRGFRLCLFGDSLIDVPTKYYSMPKALNDRIVDEVDKVENNHDSNRYFRLAIDAKGIGGKLGSSCIPFDLTN
jgi:hypothetical protein